MILYDEPLGSADTKVIYIINDKSSRDSERRIEKN